jgi:hypothetical protein
MILQRLPKAVASAARGSDGATLSCWLRPLLSLSHPLSRYAGVAVLVVSLLGALAPEAAAQSGGTVEVETFAPRLQSPPPAVRSVFAVVETALREGDARALAGHFASRVEVTVPGSSKLYSSAQATYVLADLTRRLPALHVALQAPSTSGVQWIAQGSYLAEDAHDAFRIYVRLREDADGVWRVRELRIETRS